MASNALIAALVVVIIAIIAVILYLVPAKPPASSSAPVLASVAVQLTDPAQVPIGTQALNISYSSMQLHYSYNGTSGWYGVPGSGSIDLLSLVNMAKTIGSASLPANATVDMARFNVTAAYIIINGTSYPVTIPSQQITAHLTNSRIAKGINGLLLDFAPAVATIYTLNSTIFVMVPSIKAVVVPGLNSSVTSVNYVSHIGTAAKKDLESATPNVTITGASLSVNGSTTSLSVTVKDNSNSSVVINHIMVYGNTSILISLGNGTTIQKMQMPGLGSAEQGGFDVGIGEASNISKALGAYFNVSANQSINESTILKIMRNKNLTDIIEHYSNISVSSNITQENISKLVDEASKHFGEDFKDINAMANASAALSSNLSYVEKNWENMKEMWDSMKANMTALGLNSSTFENRWHEIEASRIAIEQSHFKVLNFIVESNGTLALPFAEPTAVEGPGYTLNAGQSETFTFDNVISYGGRASIEAEAGNSTFSATIAPHVIVKPIIGDSYKIVLSGEEGARASTNVTAG